MSTRPSAARIVWRATLTTLWTSLSLWFLAWLLPGFSIDSAADALLAGVVIGLLNAVVWPALAFVVVPVSVLTLGLGAIVVDAVVVGWLL
jgi:putative membrane protein